MDEIKGSQSTLMELFGQLLAVITALSWTVSSSCSQALGGFVPRFQLNMFRFMLLWLMMLPVIIYKETPIWPERSHAVYLSILCVLMTFTNLVYYEASIYIPLGTFGGLESTCIIILTAFITSVQHKRLFPIMMLSVMVSISGIVCLTQPEFIFGQVASNVSIDTTPVCVHPTKTYAHRLSNLTESAMTSPGNETNYAISALYDTGQPTVIKDSFKGYLFSVASSVTYTAVIVLQNKYLQGADIQLLLFWLGLFGMLSSGIIMFAVETPTFPSSATCVALLFGHSITAWAATVTQVASLYLISPFAFSILVSLQLVFLLVAQFTVLQDINPGHRNIEEVIGAMLVLLASISKPAYTLCTNWRESKSDQNETRGLIDVMDRNAD